MDFTGIIIGAASFLIIGILHPVVIHAEYHYDKGIWPVFFASRERLHPGIAIHRQCHPGSAAGHAGAFAIVVHA